MLSGVGISQPHTASLHESRFLCGRRKCKTRSLSSTCLTAAFAISIYLDQGYVAKFGEKQRKT